MKEFQVSKPIPLEGTFNFRDLGGYPAGDAVTVKGRYFRADGLGRLTDADRAWLRERDITCVIDLRRQEEREQSPDALGDGFEYHAVSLSDRIYDGAGDLVFTDCLSDLYRVMLDTHQRQFAEVMQRIAARGKRPLVFHCTAGKDRTGLTAMFLLSLAGVSEDVIEADYAPSGENMAPFFAEARKWLRREHSEIPEFLYQSPAAEMRATLDYIRAQWGTPREYLRQCGVSEEQLDTIRRNLLEA